MALSKVDALDAVREVLMYQQPLEATRLNRIHDALNTDPYRDWAPTVQIPADAPQLMQELAKKSETNYLPLLVKTFSQVMKVDAYTTNVADADNPWQWWQRNRMDSRQTGLTRSALEYGSAYAVALPGKFGLAQEKDGPAISLFSPRQMTALYQNPSEDEWPMLAVSTEVTGKADQIVTLYDEECQYLFGLETQSIPAVMNPSLMVPFGTGSLKYIETREHGLGVTPVVRYRDRNLLLGEELFGIVEPLMRIQERITETTFQMMVAQYFQAFKQRYVLGWVPKNEAEELKASAAQMWYLDEDPADVKIDQLDGGDPAPYIATRNSAIRDFAAIGQIPAQSMGIDGISNISDATLAGLEAAKNREGGEIMTSLGESHEQLMRLCAHIAGVPAAAEDYNSEIRWRNFEARSYQQVVAGLVQLGAGLGIPTEALLSDIPGFTGQRVAEVESLMKRQQAQDTLRRLTAAAQPQQPDQLKLNALQQAQASQRGQAAPDAGPTGG